MVSKPNEVSLPASDFVLKLDDRCSGSSRFEFGPPCCIAGVARVGFQVFVGLLRWTDQRSKSLELRMKILGVSHSIGGLRWGSRCIHVPSIVVPDIELADAASRVGRDAHRVPALVASISLRQML